MAEEESTAGTLNSDEEAGIALHAVTVFHQGYGNAPELWFNSIRDINGFLGGWQGDKKAHLTNVAFGTSPAALSFGGKLIVFAGNRFPTQTWLSFAIFDNGWKPETVQQPISGSPSAVPWNRMIYVFYADGSGNLVYSLHNGTTWTTGATSIGNTRLANSPTAVVYNGKLWLFFQSASQNGQIWWTTFDGQRWSAASTVPSALGIDASASPGAIVAWNGLYVLFKARNGALAYCFWNGSSWSQTDQTIPDTDCTDAPAGFVDGLSGLWVFHQGHNFNGQLWYNRFGSKGWVGDQRLANTGMSGRPCVLYNYLPPATVAAAAPEVDATASRPAPPS
jgi:hypothetical protein